MGAAGKGYFEIERRYLVHVDGGMTPRLPEGYAFVQGYVKNGTPSVRIRIGEPRGPVLTLKSGRGVRRREVETIVPLDVAHELLRAAGKKVIQKVRYPLDPWELDRFEGPLEGLWLLEIELERVDEPVPEPPDGVEILREVTDDKRFLSGHLARMSTKEQARMVTWAYRELDR